MKLMVVHGYSGRLDELESHGLLSREREYYSALQEAIGQVCVVSPDPRRFKLDDDGRVIHLPLARACAGMSSLPSHRWLFRRALSTFRPEAVLADMTSAPLWPGRSGRFPLILRTEWFWSDVAREEDSILEARAKAALENYMARRADAVSASTSEVAERMRFLGARRAEVVPNFVAREFFDEGTRRKAAHIAGRARLLSVGRLVPIKRHALLIDALALVPAEVRPMLTLVGRGPLRDELLRRARGRSVEIDLLERVENVQLAALMRTMDALMHVSSHEGAPRVMLEAFAARLPVLSVRWRGVDQLAGGNGERAVLLPDDAAGIARRVDDLVRGLIDEQLTLVSRDAREWAVSTCSLTAHVALTRELISRTLKGWR